MAAILKNRWRHRHDSISDRPITTNFGSERQNGIPATTDTSQSKLEIGIKYVGHPSSEVMFKAWNDWSPAAQLRHFYRAAWNADAVYSDEKAVCPSICLSVCLSVKRVHCDKTEERSVQIFILYERSFSLVFCEEEWLVGNDPFYLKFLVNRHPLERNLNRYSLVPPQP